MEREIITLKTDFLSRQSNSKGEPVVDLKAGDIVELREDGIYFTRKINLEGFDSQRKANFENIRHCAVNLQSGYFEISHHLK